MPTTYHRGDIWDCDADAIVIPVNCVGVMGAGLARQCRERFRAVEEQYREDCRNGFIERGKVREYMTGRSWPKKLYLAATKVHWKYPSKIEWVRDCLQSLAWESHRQGDISVAVPMLGCGLGQLKWEQVQPLVEKILGPEKTIFYIFGEKL